MTDVLVDFWRVSNRFAFKILTFIRILSKQKGANGKSSRPHGLVAKRACVVHNPHKREDLS